MPSRVLVETSYSCYQDGFLYCRAAEKVTAANDCFESGRVVDNSEALVLLMSSAAAAASSAPISSGTV